MNIFIKKKLSSVLMFCVMFFSFQYISAEESLEKVVLQLKWTHQYQFAGYYVAIEKGFYKDVGLDLVLKEGLPDMNVVDEVTSGHSNFGILMPNLILERAKGKPVVVLAAIYQHSPQVLIARKDSGIQTPQDLVGHTLMDGNIEIQAMILSEGVQIDKIKRIRHSWSFEDLKNNKTDAMVAYNTDLLELVQLGISFNVIRPLTYGIDFYGDCLFTSEKEIKEHPERVKKFREASLRGWEFAMKNPDEVAGIILSKYHSEQTREQLLYEAESMRGLILPDLVELGHMNPGRWKHIGDTYVKLGLLKPDYSLEGFIYDLNTGVDHSAHLRVIGFLSGILLFIAMVTSGLFAFNRKLKKNVERRTRELQKINLQLKKEIDNHSRAEKALQNSEDQFQRLLNSINDVVWAADIDGQLLYINSAAETIYDRELSEFYANPDLWIESVHKDDRDGVLKQSELLFENGFTENQYRVISKNGAIRWVGDRKSVVYDQAGKVVQIGGIASDITKEKQALDENRQIMSELKQRLKELDCIYKISNSIRLRKTLEQVFQDVVKYIPPGWQYPESICCRVNFEGKEYLSENFVETPWKLTSDIISGHRSGEIDVFYLKEFPPLDEGPFTKEEKDLLNAISHALAEAGEHEMVQKINENINRALTLYSECNKIIAYAQDEFEILNKICRLIVGKGNYRFAWIGFADQDREKKVRPVASHEFEEGFFDDVKITWDDTEFGQGPVGTAIREKKSIVCKHIDTDPKFSIWREKVQKKGGRSLITLPLITENYCFGVLNIYAHEENAFDHDERILLEELADDLAHGITAMRSNEYTKHAEASLQVERNKLSSVVNGIGDSLHIINMDNIIEFQNDMSLERFGDLVGKQCYEGLFKREKPCEDCHIQKALRENSIMHMEVDSINKKNYEVTFSPFTEAGGEVKSIVVFRDITEKKFLQTETMRTSHLASLGELAAGVAHEINNPVTGIISIAEILSDKFHELGGDRGIPERIVREGERIGNIVRNLLSFAREQKDEHSPAHIQEVLQLAIDLLEKQIFKDGIRLSVSLPSDFPEIQMNSQELQQVFINILSNARYAVLAKYPEHDEKKQIEIKGQIIDIEDSKYVRLIFCDSGVGISEKNLEKITDPFFSSKPRGEGTGLGLSISHGIIKSHGGRLWFESREGEYTKVMVDLPFNR